MSASKIEASATGPKAVMRVFVRGRVALKPEFVTTLGEEPIDVCRIEVIGDAGPASSPPRVALYITGNRGSTRPDEAKRCAFGLNRGDWIEAAGDVGPERATARRQEVLVSEPVKLRGRAAGRAGAA